MKGNEVSVAPMVGITNKHTRRFYRHLSNNTLLYTEMIIDQTIIKNPDKFLLDQEDQHPLAIQVASNNASKLSAAIKLINKHKFYELNLNCGCPSSKLAKSGMGIMLMLDIDKTSDLIKSMLDHSSSLISIKHRIGIDDNEGIDFSYNFINHLYELGCRKFIIHARKAITKASCRNNRNIPPIDRSVVYKLKEEFPAAQIIINGAYKNIEDIKSSINKVNGVMLGRAISKNPWLLHDIEKNIFNSKQDHNKLESALWLVEYIEKNPDINISNLRGCIGIFSNMHEASKLRSSIRNINRSKIIDLFMTSK